MGAACARAAVGKRSFLGPGCSLAIRYSATGYTAALSAGRLGIIFSIAFMVPARGVLQFLLNRSAVITATAAAAVVVIRGPLVHTE